MAESLDPQAVADKIDGLLDDIGRHSDPAVHAAAGELVRLLMEFYGAGLQQIVTIVQAGSGDTMVHRLAADPAVAGLLALHDLHPVDMQTRIEHAFSAARRKLGSHSDDVELLGVDEEAVVTVRVIGKGCGVATVRDVVQKTLLEAAPEMAGVEFVEAPAGPPLMQIGMRPPARATQ
jgi:Fe-S cluster biogenesis protein NfuA